MTVSEMTKINHMKSKRVKVYYKKAIWSFDSQLWMNFVLSVDCRIFIVIVTAVSLQIIFPPEICFVNKKKTTKSIYNI